MTMRHGALARRIRDGLRLSRFLKSLGAVVLAAALTLGVPTSAVAEEPGAPTIPSCPEDTFCIDTANETSVNNIPTLLLGDGESGPFLLVPGDAIRGGFDVMNTGNRETRVVVTMGWMNERCVGESFADDPYLMSLPHPGGATTFYSPGMNAKVDYNGGSMAVDSLRCNGSVETSVLTVAPGETLTFDARIAFPFMENGNDTQKEHVTIDFRIRWELDDPLKIPVPAAPDVNDPCGPDNATWQVPADTGQLDWTLAPDGTLSVSPQAGFEFDNGEAGHSYGTAPDSGVACPTPTPTPTPTPSPEVPSPSPSPVHPSTTPSPVAPSPTPSVAPGRPSRPGLASTGANVTGAAVGVGGLVIAGGLLLLARRRKSWD